jgi:ferredoxin
MLVIDPLVCIDCGVCEIECPAQAIMPDTHPDAVQWLELNKEYSSKWPSITQKIPPPDDADAWLDVKNKMTKYFDPNLKAE